MKLIRILQLNWMAQCLYLKIYQPHITHLIPFLFQDFPFHRFLQLSLNLLSLHTPSKLKEFIGGSSLRQGGAVVFIKVA